ncbi:uncharacterized protein LOC117604532 [Osmia lignaria lignaria]|uniref:uncharacterized protein LOC117604532 n=1 Tax=Osmia lignaria lignaria TaxID=1437193 RepID=UPI00402BBCC2
MLGLLLRKVSSKAISALQKIKKLRLDALNDAKNNSIEKARSQLQEYNVQETINFILKKGSSTVKTLNDSLKIILPTETIVKVPLNTLSRYHGPDTIRRQIASHQKIINHQTRWMNSCGSNKKFKLVKRNTNIIEELDKRVKLKKSKKLSKSNRDQNTDDTWHQISESSHESPMSKSGHSNQKSIASHPEKPEEYSNQQTSMKHSKDHAESAESNCPNKDSRLNEQDQKELPRARVTCDQRPERRSCCSQKNAPPKKKRKFEESSKSDCRQLKPVASIVVEEVATPDPPPPRSSHWSENLNKPREYRSPCSRKSAPSPMIFIPYQKSSESNKPVREDSSPRKYPSQNRPIYSTCKRPSMKRPSEEDDSSSCNKYRMVSEEKDERQTRVPVKEKSNREVKSQASIVVFAKSEKPFEISDVSDCRPNTAALKYRMSKCPSMQGSLQSGKRKFPGDEIVSGEETTKSSKLRRTHSSEKKERFKSTSEWKKQTYPIRLKIYKTKDDFNPCPPVISEIRPRDPGFVEEIKEPRLSPVHREIAKRLKDPCPPKYCPHVDIEKTKLKTLKEKQRCKKKAKRQMKCPHRGDS